MAHISVAVVVDVENLLASKNQNDIYMIDNKGYNQGYTGEGKCELQTICDSGDTIEWRAVAVNPNNNVKITGFTGEAMQEGIIDPTEQGITGNKFWQTSVETRTANNYQYSIVLDLDGKSVTFDPWVNVEHV